MKIAVPAVVAVAAKKILFDLLTDKRTWVAIGSVITGIVLLFVFPAMVLLGMSSAATNSGASVIVSADDSQTVALNAALTEIQDRLTASGLTDQVQKAQAIFSYFLYDAASNDPDFMDRYIVCFAVGQTDTQLLDTINNAFGVTISVSDLNSILSGVQASEIFVANFTNPQTKTPPTSPPTPSTL